MNDFLTRYFVGLGLTVGVTLWSAAWLVIITGFGNLFWLAEHANPTRLIAFVFISPLFYAGWFTNARSRR